MKLCISIECDNASEAVDITTAIRDRIRPVEKQPKPPAGSSETTAAPTAPAAFTKPTEPEAGAELTAPAAEASRAPRATPDEREKLMARAKELGLAVASNYSTKYIKEAIARAEKKGAAAPATPATAPEVQTQPEAAPAEEPAAVEPEPTPAEPAKTATPPVTIDEVRRVLALLMSKKGPDAGMNLLGGFGAQKVSLLKPEQYGPIVDKANALLKG